MEPLLMAAITGVLFPPVVAGFRRWWRSAWFWTAVSGLFVLHVLACAVAWMVHAEWRAFAYGALSLTESAMLPSALVSLGFRVDRAG